MGHEYTIKNYDTSGSWTIAHSVAPDENGKKPETRIINGIEHVKTGDGKIGLSEFKTALIDFYQDTYGTVGSSNKDSSIFSQIEFQRFQEKVNNFDLGGEISIDNDEDFVALLTSKAKELREQMTKEQKEKNPDVVHQNDKNSNFGL